MKIHGSRIDVKMELEIGNSYFPKRGSDMKRQSIFDMKFSDVYPLLIQKAERKNRTRSDVYEVTSWLTGYTAEQIDAFLVSDITYGSFPGR